MLPPPAHTSSELTATPESPVELETEGVVTCIKRHNQADIGVEDDIKARRDHIAQLGHIVRGPRHDVAHALAIVKGLAFAQAELRWSLATSPQL